MLDSSIVPIVCANLGGWGNRNVSIELSELLGGIRVLVGNDANVAALGEIWMGAAQGCRLSLIHIFDNDVNYFLVFLGGKLIGYFAWKMENTALHLMHLYLKPEYRGKAIGRDIVQTCERLAKGEGKGRVWCTIHAKALPVQQFFKALRYRELRPAEQETGSVPRNELVYEHTLS